MSIMLFILSRLLMLKIWRGEGALDMHVSLAAACCWLQALAAHTRAAPPIPHPRTHSLAFAHSPTSGCGWTAL